MAGYFGGWIDNVLMRFVDVVLSLPFLFLILMIVCLFGIRDMRVVDHRDRDRGLDDRRPARPSRVPLPARDGLRAAAKALGRRANADHHPPHAAGRDGAARRRAGRSASPTPIIGESALSVLGFGIAPPEISLGQMLNDYREYFYAHPERILYPGIVLVVIVLCASFLGDGLRDALDPRQRGGG